MFKCGAQRNVVRTQRMAAVVSNPLWFLGVFDGPGLLPASAQMLPDEEPTLAMP